MRVLGVDPGSWRTGWGLLTGTSVQPCLVDCGVIRLRRGVPFASRLHELRESFEPLVLKLRPDAAAVESPFHGASARASLQLAHARGVILAVLAAAGVEIAEYSPATVKKAVTGNGRADKDQVRRMVVRLLRSDAIRAEDDLSDALAVSLCHLASAGYLASVHRGGRR